ncbi:AbrB/MazE/SpoVT family DNA-binding domain-containing protein (plasmid) [Methanocaldococcus sp. 10A]
MEKEKFGIRKIIKRREKKNDKEYCSFMVVLPKEWITLAKIDENAKLEVEGNENELILKVIRKNIKTSA